MNFDHAAAMFSSLFSYFYEILKFAYYNVLEMVVVNLKGILQTLSTLNCNYRRKGVVLQGFHISDAIR